MATINEISNAAGYVGNAALGGAGELALNIDWRPLQQLAQYTFLYNKSEYDQRQKDAERAAAEIADAASYDITTAIPKDAKVLQEKYDGLIKFMADNPTAMNYRNKEQWAEYKRLRNDLDNDVKSAGTREVIKLARQSEIQNETNPLEKERLQKSLDAEIDKTDIRTTLQHTDKFNIEPVKYVAPKNLKFTVSKEFPNYLSSTDVVTFDMSDVNNQANAVVLGLSKSLNPQTDLEKQQYEAQVNTGKLEPILSAKNISAAIKDYVTLGPDQNGSAQIFNADAAKDSGNGILSGIVSNVEAFNRKMDATAKAIEAGAFKDKLNGGVQAFGVNGLDAKDYKKIDLNKGFITPEEYVKLQILSLAQPIQSDTKLTPTDNQIQKEQIAAQRENAQLDYKVAWYNATHKGDGSKAEVANTGIQTPAIMFGEHINRIKQGLANPKYKDGFTVSFTGTDENTRKATGVTKGQSVTYKPDGTFIIIDDKTKNSLKSGTLEELKQGYIDAVKAMDATSGAQTKDFQVAAETAFTNIFGTLDGNAIFNGWGIKENQSTKPNEPVVETHSRSDYKDGGWTDKQIDEAVKAGKIKLK